MMIYINFPKRIKQIQDEQYNAKEVENWFNAYCPHCYRKLPIKSPEEAEKFLRGELVLSAGARAGT